MENEKGETPFDRFIPLEGMPFVCSYLSTRDIERLRSTCTTMRSLVDTSINMLPKKIEQCDLKLDGPTAIMNFVIKEGCNNPSKTSPNGFTISTFLHHKWKIAAMNQFHVELIREIDDDFWKSVCDGFSLAIFDGYTLEMPLTDVNVNGLCYALRSSKFDEFRITISKFDSLEIGELLSDLIGSRINRERELSHLTYCLISLKGESFDLAADFLLSLARKVPSFEVEYIEKLMGWEYLLNVDHLIKFQLSRCEEISLYAIRTNNLSRKDIDLVVKLFLQSTFSRILRMAVLSESFEEERFQIQPTRYSSVYYKLDSNLPNSTTSELEISGLGGTHMYLKLTVEIDDE